MSTSARASATWTAPRSTASTLLAQSEGILVDPTYSGKGLACLIDQVRQGRFRASENIVFVHTGGTPLLFAYGEALLADG